MNLASVTEELAHSQSVKMNMFLSILNLTNVTSVIKELTHSQHVKIKSLSFDEFDISDKRASTLAKR